MTRFIMQSLLVVFLATQFSVCACDDSGSGDQATRTKRSENRTSGQVGEFLHLVRNGEGVAVRAVLVGPKVTDDDLEQLKQHRKLRLIECFATSIRGSGFQHLAELPELTAVKLYGSVLNDEAAPHIAKMKSLKQLQMMNVLYRDYSSDARRKIDKQYVNENVGFTDKGLRQVLTNRSIISLHLPCHHLSRQAIADLIKVDRLYYLGLEGADLSLDRDFEFGASNETLTLVSCKLETSFLNALAHHSRLRNIEIYLPNASSLDLSQLSKVRQLRGIILRGFPEDQFDISSLESKLPFTNIRTDTPLKRSAIAAKLKDSDTTQLACLVGLVSDTRIHAANLVFSEGGSVLYESVDRKDRSYELYADLQLLRFLEFINCITICSTPLRPEDEQLLLDLKNRQAIDLSDTMISDDFVESFCTTGKSSKTIEELLIEHNALTDACLPAVAKLPSLTRLSLSWNPITDEGVKAISRNQSIKELYLSHCPDVSDAALEHLARMPSLRKLSVGHTRVSEQGIMHLQSNRPELEIIE